MTAGWFRASDADRDQVADILNLAYAEGRISSDEHSERLEATNRAKTFDDLTPLTRDLVPRTAPAPTAPRPVERSGALVGEGDDRLTAALSNVKRQGPWRVRRRTLANVFLGGVELDLTQASFDEQIVEFNVTQVLGSVFLRVPTGTTVRDEMANVLAETTVKGLGRPDPALPIIVLRGTNVLGEIKVRGPKRASVWKRALT